ncbi:MAG: DUF4296 domain-containing protein [Bacteroidaceae bacterium]
MRNLPFLFVLLITMVCVSCKKKMPTTVLSESKMENVLYDYHLAQALALQAGDSASFKQQIYIAAVFQKYGITSAQFDSSMVWYTRNTEKLYNVYTRINKRYEASSKALGGSMSARSHYASMSSTGDTANVWNDKVFYILTPTELFNRLSFTMKADSSFHVGDEFRWNFNTNFVYKEGARDAIVVLSLCYTNDSVVSTTQRIMNDGERSIQLSSSKLPIKRIQGFIYLNERSRTSTKLLMVSNLSLIKMHNSSVPIDTSHPVDSLSHLSDTVGKQTLDTMEAKRKHPLSPRRSPLEMKSKPSSKPRFI